MVKFICGLRVNFGDHIDEVDDKFERAVGSSTNYYENDKNNDQEIDEQRQKRITNHLVNAPRIVKS